jgi:hypothetical protein
MPVVVIMKLMVTTKNSEASRPPRTAAFGNHGLRPAALLPTAQRIRGIDQTS